MMAASSVLEKETKILRKESLIMSVKKLLAKALRKRYSKVSMWSWYQEENETDIDRIFVDKLDMTPQDYYNIFSQERKSKGDRIALIGDAGVGKDTLARKILTDWSNLVLDYDNYKADCEYLDRFALIVPIFCRSFVQNATLVDILEGQLNLQRHEAQSLYDNIDNHQKNVLFLIVGYDMLAAKYAQVIDDIVNGKWFSASILVTQRSHSFKRLGKQMYTETEIHGFTDEGKKDYIERFFKLKHSCVDVKTLLAEVTRDKDLRLLSKIPANLLLICCLWLEGEKLPETMTGLYWEFLQYMCGRYEKNFLPRRKRAARKDIVNRYVDQFQELASLATRGLLVNDLSATFDLQYAKEILSTVAWRLGILMTTKNTEKKVKFIHRTMQEFFIALQVVYDTHGQGMDTLLIICSSREHFSYARTVLAFVCGLSMKLSQRLKRVIETEMEKWIDDGTENNHQYRTHFFIMMFSEAEAHFSLPPLIHLDVAIYEQSLLKRFFTLPGQNVKEIKLINVNRPGQLEFLTKLLQTDLELIEISGICETPEVNQGSQNRYMDFSFLARLSPVSVKLGKNLDRGSILAFLKGLVGNMCLESLALEDCKLTEEGFEVLSKTTRSCVGLKELYLTRCGCYCESSMQKVMESLSRHKQLQVVSSKDNIFGECGLSQLTKSLSGIFSLRVLQLRSIRCEVQDTWMTLLLSVTNMALLQELDLSCNELCSKVFEKLAELLRKKTWRTLEKLVLDFCAINDLAAMSVVSSAIVCISMRHISLEGNSLGDGMEKISELGRQLRYISVMKLGSNNISQKVANVIYKSFQEYCPHACLELDLLQDDNM